MFYNNYCFYISTNCFRWPNSVFKHIYIILRFQHWTRWRKSAFIGLQERNIQDTTKYIVSFLIVTNKKNHPIQKPPEGRKHVVDRNWFTSRYTEMESICKRCDACIKLAHCVRLVRDNDGRFFKICCCCITKHPFFWKYRGRYRNKHVECEHKVWIEIH